MRCFTPDFATHFAQTQQCPLALAAWMAYTHFQQSAAVLEHLKNASLVRIRRANENLPKLLACSADILHEGSAPIVKIRQQQGVFMAGNGVQQPPGEGQFPFFSGALQRAANRSQRLMRAADGVTVDGCTVA